MADEAIEVDTAVAAGDVNEESIDEQLSSFTASVTSSVLNYPVEHGRRYHAYRSGVYWGPNDEPELDRLDLHHALMVKGIGDKLYLAPIVKEKQNRILDIGTGTGIWAMSMGDETPNALILGNDLSAIQPVWVPPNVSFEIDDVESEWSHAIPFDFIFCRYMTCSIRDWPKLVKSIYSNVVPGGWAEFQDYDLQWYSDDGSLTKDHFSLMWINTLLEAARKIHRDPCPGVKLEEWVKDAGFENVTHHKFKFPIGPWPKDSKLKQVGLYNLASGLQGLEAFSLRLFCDVLGWKSEEVLVLTSKVRKEMKSSAFHAYVNFHAVYGQKPAK